MPSWSTSEARRDEEAATPPADTAASELESARKLLEELFAEHAPGDPSLQTEQ